MDPRFQTSFIPKKPIVSSAGRAPSPINLFFLLGTVIFIVTLVLAGGVFFYKKVTLKQIGVDKGSFNLAKNDFEPDAINKIMRLNTRIEIGKKILGEHIAVTPLFDYISTITLKSVRFRDFTFTYLAKDKIQIQMKGQTKNYASVALQSDLLNEQTKLKNITVGDMSLEASGAVSFSVSATVDPTIFSYPKSIGIEVVEPKLKATTTPPKQ